MLCDILRLICILQFPTQMVTHSLTGDYNDVDVVAAPKLMEVVLAHCPGAVDRWVGAYVSLAWSRLQTATRRPLQDQLIAFVAVALHYNAGLALQALESRGATQQLLQGWAEMLAKRRPSGRKPAHFRQQRLKKLSSLGLVALLAAPEAALPPAVAVALPAVLRGAVMLLSDLKAQQDDAAANMAAGSGSVEEEVRRVGLAVGNAGTGNWAGHGRGPSARVVDAQSCFFRRIHGQAPRRP